MFVGAHAVAMVVFVVLMCSAKVSDGNGWIADVIPAQSGEKNTYSDRRYGGL